jgi:acetyl-CoA synthase
MPKELKTEVAAKMNKTAKELYNIDGFSDMICDETIATDPDKIVDFLKGKNHPAFGMETIMEAAGPEL